MAALSAEYNLNQLAAEAIVTADADLVVGIDAPKIRDTALAQGLTYRLASLSPGRQPVSSAGTTLTAKGSSVV